MVNRLSHDLLARATFAGDQDRGVFVACHLGDLLHHPLHLGAFGDDIHRRGDFEAPAQQSHLFFEPLGLYGQADDQLDHVGFEGFFDVVVGPQLQGFDGRFHRGVTRDDNHQQVGVELLGALEHIDPVQVRQVQIQQDQVHVTAI